MSDEPPEDDDNVTPLRPPEKPDTSIDDCIASIAALASALASASPNDRVLKGKLEHPATIEDAARVIEATRNASCPIARKEKAIDAEAAFRKALTAFLPAKALDQLQRRIETRVKALWREERRSKRAKQQELHDATLADAFIEVNEVFRQRGGGVWLWKDSRWRPGSEALAPALDAYRQAIAGDDADARSELLSSKKLSALVRAVEASAQLKIMDVSFDAARDLLGLADGRVCELRTGLIRAARASDLVTMRTAIVPVKGPSPVWHWFLAETFRHDAALVAAVKRNLGYQLTGEISLRKAFIFDGTGNNGKTTLCELMRGMLGDYGELSSTNIVASGYKGHDTVFAALANKRFVEIPEIDHMLVLGARFKELTGNNSISGRGMRENASTYPNRLKLNICANSNVKFDATSKSFAARICTIPFRNAVAADKLDLELGVKLMAEAPAILAELIEEAAAFYADPRLLPCTAIEEATAAYIGEADRYGAWFEASYVKLDPKQTNANAPDFVADDLKQALVEAAGQSTIPDNCLTLGEPLKTVFESWQRFAIAEGDYVGNSKLLASALRERGIIVGLQRTSRTNFVVGIHSRASIYSAGSSCESTAKTFSGETSWDYN